MKVKSNYVSIRHTQQKHHWANRIINKVSQSNMHDVLVKWKLQHLNLHFPILCKMHICITNTNWMNHHKGINHRRSPSLSELRCSVKWFISTFMNFLNQNNWPSSTFLSGTRRENKNNKNLSRNIMTLSMSVVVVDSCKKTTTHYQTVIVLIEFFTTKIFMTDFFVIFIPSLSIPL